MYKAHLLFPDFIPALIFLLSEMIGDETSFHLHIDHTNFYQPYLVQDYLHKGHK